MTPPEAHQFSSLKVDFRFSRMQSTSNPRLDLKASVIETALQSKPVIELFV
ncbi:hypothetical protein SALWKB12_1619 [Snodgrassella communis]|uniref:Uncharacterized protein n=1 Tax=Snodgrassella communis TaxID=2946699 RepID=A0A836MPB5_9NEIS|nr:hypothetical protein SALWKB12_1619 [Snodgrassella communis]KDN14568.1 hypothetical protein SALWKB29_1358 [Snodgrassella communis]